MLRNWLICLCLIIPGSSLFAQYKLEKWGQIPVEDLQLTVYPQDSGAKAVILQDHGSIATSMSGSKPIVIFKMHRRIKIFDETALDNGNIFIPFLSNRRSVKLSDLEVQVVQPDGTKQKVQSDNIYTEQLSQKVSAKKIFIPNLQKGCIIEYRYQMVTDDIISLQDWYFQHDIPVRWSELEVNVPRFFNYTSLLRTPKKFDIQPEQKETGEENTFLRYGISHLPALKEEPYMTTIDDYRAHIGFQLNTVSFPYQPVEKYMNTWNDAAKKLESYDGFGAQYLKQGRSKKLWEAFELAGHANAPIAEIPERVLRFVSSEIVWNEEYRFTMEEDLDDIYEKKTGSSGAINLAVVALLRKAGIDACPALISTRDNGEMYPEYPFIEQFNSVLAYVKLSDTSFFIDAIDPFHQLNELSTEHQHAMAWVVDSKDPKWVACHTGENSETWFGEFTLSESGDLNGAFALKLTGHRASQWRKELHKIDHTKALKAYFEDNFAEIAIDSIKIKNADSFDKALEVRFKCQIKEAFPAVNDFVYINPVFYYPISENPFKSVKRDFPVSFPWPLQVNYVVSVNLPQGYALEELPAGIKLLLPENGGAMTYSCSKSSTANRVQLLFKTAVSQLEFAPHEYPALRQFFDLVAEKAQSPIVIKKAQ